MKEFTGGWRECKAHREALFAVALPEQLWCQPFQQGKRRTQHGIRRCRQKSRHLLLYPEYGVNKRSNERIHTCISLCISAIAVSNCCPIVRAVVRWAWETASLKVCNSLRSTFVAIAAYIDEVR